jgi:hypothetical protein
VVQSVLEVSLEAQCRCERGRRKRQTQCAAVEGIAQAAGAQGTSGKHLHWCCPSQGCLPTNCNCCLLGAAPGVQPALLSQHTPEGAALGGRSGAFVLFHPGEGQIPALWAQHTSSSPVSGTEWAPAFLALPSRHTGLPTCQVLFESCEFL